MKLSSQIVVISIFLLSFGVINYFVTYLPSKELEKNHRYTLAIVNSFQSNSESSKVARITYRYKNRTYHETFPLTLGYSDKFKIGSRVFIKFSPKDPENAEVDYDTPVPDKLEAPVLGWKRIPK